MTSLITNQNVNAIDGIDEQESVSNNVITYLEFNRNEIEIELAKAPEDRNQEKLFIMISKTLVLFARVFGKIDQDYVGRMAVELLAQARTVQANYDCLGNKVCTAISVGISVLACGAAFGPEAIAKASHALSGLATGSSSVGGIFSTAQEGKKQFLLTMFENDKRQRDDSSGRTRTAKETCTSTTAALEDFFRNMKSARQEFLRPA